MTGYALRLANGEDTAPRVRAGDALVLTPNGTVRARGGFRNDGGGVVSVSAGTMNVSVSPFSCWVDAAPAGQVGYPFVSDATATLAIDPGDATLSRTDVVAVVVRENAYDGGGVTSATLEVVKGTPGAGAPALPAAALPLREVVVPAGTSAGTGGLSAGMLGTDRRVFTTAAGGVIPVASAAERNALGAVEGWAVYRKDTDVIEVYDGAAWHTWFPMDGAWQSWSPTYVGITVGNGSVVARYRQIGQTVHFRWEFTIGSTSSVSGGSKTLSLPVAAQPFRWRFNAELLDAGTANYVLTGRVVPSVSASNVELMWTSQTDGKDVFITAGAPVGLGVGDTLSMCGTYEAA